MLAPAILVYHYASFSGIEGPLLRVLGIYAVAMFYVVSGVSLAFAHADLQLRVPDMIRFGVNRYFRLAPVYWFVTAGTLWLRAPTARGIFLNLTLLFGVIAPGSALPGGGWSVGNEVAFACLFPFAIAAMRAGPRVFLSLLAGWVVVGSYFAFHVLTATRGPELQWSLYIRPQNQAFLFVAGMGLAAGIGRVQLTRPATLAALLGIALAGALLPHEDLITGWTRFGYAGLCVALAAVATFGTLGALPGWTERWIGALAARTYALYLVHPTAYLLLKLSAPHLTTLTAALVATAGSVAIAEFAHRMIEVPMIAVGRRAAASITQERGIAARPLLLMAPGERANPLIQ